VAEGYGLGLLGFVSNAAHFECAFYSESRRLTFCEVFAVENHSKSTQGVCVPGSYLWQLFIDLNLTQIPVRQHCCRCCAAE